MAYGKRMKKTTARKKRPVRGAPKKRPVRGAAKKKGTRRLVDDPAYRRARRNRMTESKIALNARTRTPESRARNAMHEAQVRRGIAQPYRSGPDL
jgi:hypothetical protein